ncbi:MAG: two pore domain potassium channel family protein [Nitriliruptoraceae bacterium]|nr:two pore domain potassium channel family protein [Nitriliruptoraceae bacterium]
MIATVVATVRFIRAVAGAAWDPATRGVVVLGVLTLVTGTVFYRWAEGWGFVDALYFSVVTLTTIGFGDLTPSSSGAKLFTIVYSLVGIGIIAMFITSLAVVTRERWDRDHGTGRHAPEADPP